MRDWSEALMKMLLLTFSRRRGHMERTRFGQEVEGGEVGEESLGLSFFFAVVFKTIKKIFILFLIGGEMLYNIVLYINMISHRYTYEPPSSLPPHPTPLGCHKALG